MACNEPTASESSSIVTSIQAYALTCSRTVSTLLMERLSSATLKDCLFRTTPHGSLWDFELVH